MFYSNGPRTVWKLCTVFHSTYKALAVNYSHGNHRIQIEIAKKHALRGRCITTSFNMGLSLAKGQKLVF